MTSPAGLSEIAVSKKQRAERKTHSVDLWPPYTQENALKYMRTHHVHTHTAHVHKNQLGKNKWINFLKTCGSI